MSQHDHTQPRGGFISRWSWRLGATGLTLCAFVMAFGGMIAASGRRPLSDLVVTMGFLAAVPSLVACGLGLAHAVSLPDPDDRDPQDWS